uniref:Uncharacterized protein n=1 Tax=Rousettus aegyptiacus TaxID=9407 RepID=A0A7J8E8F5_ROUAE|nr:hypothetical protein HJG63_008141 [Rousettus aegyptiacus]
MKKIRPESRSSSSGVCVVRPNVRPVFILFGPFLSPMSYYFLKTYLWLRKSISVLWACLESPSTHNSSLAPGAEKAKVVLKRPESLISIFWEDKPFPELNIIESRHLPFTESQLYDDHDVRHSVVTAVHPPVPEVEFTTLYPSFRH